VGSARSTVDGRRALENVGRAEKSECIDVRTKIQIRAYRLRGLQKLEFWIGKRACLPELKEVKRVGST